MTIHKFARGLGAGRMVAMATVASLLALTGCSGAKTREPSKLVSIDKPDVRPDDVWSRRVGDGSGGQYTDLRVALGDDALYVAALDGKVAALNPLTGDVLWRARTDTRIAGGPSLDGDLILLGTLDAQVVALKRATGKEAWRAKSTSEVLAPPVGAGNIVVTRAVDGHLYGLNSQTGNQVWAFDRTVPNLTLRGLSAPLIVNNRIYCGLDNGHVIALSLADGQLLWDQALSVATGRTELDRLIDVDADIVAGQDGLFVVTFGSDLALVDPQSGQARWRRSVKSYTGMALGAGSVYVTDADGYVIALDAETGAQIWKQDGLKYRRLSPPAFFDGHVVVGDYDGHLHWLSPKDGQIVARTRMGSDPIVAPPVVGPKYLYVMNVDGKVAAFEAPARH